MKYGVVICLIFTGCTSAAESLRKRGLVPIERSGHLVGIDAREVSQASFAAFLAENQVVDDRYRARIYPRCGFDPTTRGNHPATCVSLAEARAYCAWRGGRLPTDAEWVAAAGSGQWPTGNTPPVPGRQAWIDQPSVVDGVVNTAAVDAHPDDRSPSGIYNLTGNVREWVEAADPATRGGALNDSARFATTATRRGMEPDFAAIIVGFRCAADPR